MAKATKLPSGSWRVNLYFGKDADGKQLRKSITAPTKAEALRLAALYDPTTAPKKAKNTTVRMVIDKYIELSETLSPTTLHGYEKIKQYAFPSIMDLDIRDLTNDRMQAAINLESKRMTAKNHTPISPKTVKNEYGLLSAALRSEGLSFNVKLPKYQRHIEDLPDVQNVVQAITGTDIELPCMLALWLSFSMSEVLGLRCSDVKNGHITINQVLVSVGSERVIKNNAKVESRLRRHQLPPYILELIKAQDNYKEYLKTGTDSMLINRTRASLYGRWQTICKQNNLGDLSFHKLRHLNASVMEALRIPHKYAMERGGWSTPYVMQRVYTHTLSDERQRVDKTINGYFESIIGDSVNEIVNENCSFS